MRKRQCKRCGEIFESEKIRVYCEKCVQIGREEARMKYRQCRMCGSAFVGGPRAYYCPSCRVERKKETDLAYRRRGGNRKLGDIYQCEVCGEDYVLTSGRQRYCENCRVEAVKASDNALSIAYNKAHAEELYAKKMERHFESKVCAVCGKPFDTGNPDVTCSPECRTIHEKKWLEDRLRQKEVIKMENKLKKLREAAGLTQQQLADMANIDRSVVGKLECGASKSWKMHLSTASQLAAALGCHAEDLLDK